MSEKLPNPEAEELQDWHSYISDIKRLPEINKYKHCFTGQLRVNKDNIQRQRMREHYATKKQPLLDGHLQGETRKIMRVSKVVVEARIDLHGLTKEQANQQLQFFLITAQLHGKNWVLVITGKGRPELGLTLKSLVPVWLDNLPYVSAYSQAKPINGGNGALYVRLKKLHD